MDRSSIACAVIGPIALIAGYATAAPTPSAEPSSPQPTAQTTAPAPPLASPPEPVAAASASPPPVSAVQEPRVAWPRLEPDYKTGVVDQKPLNAALEKACGESKFDELVARLTNAGQGPVTTKFQMDLYYQGKLTTKPGADEVRVFVQRDDGRDLSIAGERYYVTFKLRSRDMQTDRCVGWLVDSARMEWRCHKGKDPNRWVRQACP